jgi:hypothetical protein
MTDDAMAFDVNIPSKFVMTVGVTKCGGCTNPSLQDGNKMMSRVTHFTKEFIIFNIRPYL